MFLHTIAMLAFENLALDDAIWLTLTTVTTVGYGDLSAQSFAGRFSTIALLYFGGIFILAKIAGDYFDYRLDQRSKMLKGQWRWKMQDHIVIINTPTHNPIQYFERLISQFREIDDYKEIPIQLLTPAYPDGLDPVLQKLGVIHFSGSATNTYNLESVNIATASHVIILVTDESDNISDSFTFDILHRLKEIGTTAKILVECIDDNNRNRFLIAGANSVIRPIRAYPELIVRAIVAPGCEIVLENLFTHGGNHTRRFNVSLSNIKWADIVCILINNNLGTALAYLDENDKIVIDPNPDEIISTHSLIILVREQHIPSENEIISAINSFQG